MPTTSVFLSTLRERNPDPAGRSWVFVPYDQLSDEVGPLARLDPSEAGIVLVETPWKAGRRRYHKQKLALVLANMRHFALEQAARGVAVRYVVGREAYRDALDPVIDELGPLAVMEPAERELRVDLEPLATRGRLEVHEHEGWLTTSEEFERSQKGQPPWRMDAFYRLVRRDAGILMEGSRPAGGKWSFDAENRRAWSGEPPAPEPPTFPLDPVKEEVLELVEDIFGDHPGALVPSQLTATREDAEALWAWALEHCLPHFGPYEDAMTEASASLFHTRISFLLNVHRLLPRRVVADAAAAQAPLASREGFVRQVLGWREFVRHVHRITDGFREGFEPPGAPSFLGAADPLPAAWWGTPSGLRCLDQAVEAVVTTGYTHHIPRLMVLSNVATLLDVSPRELTDWFWAMFVDAFDWVVEPNVLGMGTFAAGDLMTTKPYVSGAAYINRMGDSCGACAFDPRSDCPLTPLYWAFLARHEPTLKANPRMRLSLASMSKRAADLRAHDEQVFAWARRTLAAGRRLEPVEGPA